MRSRKLGAPPGAHRAIAEQSRLISKSYEIWPCGTCSQWGIWTDARCSECRMGPSVRANEIVKQERREARDAAA